MFCKSYCAAVIGVDARIVQIEADVNNGMPVFQLVGYLNSEVREAKERVRSAIKNAGFSFPAKRVTINLSPADFRKEGTAYDLGIAVSLLCAAGYIRYTDFEKIMFAGELSLDGHINRINGVLPIVMAAKEKGFRYCFVPNDNVKEGAMVSDICTIGVNHILQVINILSEGNFDAYKADYEKWDNSYELRGGKNFFDVDGQAMVKRASLLAVSGGHNMLMIGPPGAGKTMIAERLPGIMPLLTLEESLEVSKIYSSSSMFSGCEGYLYERPFRSPHHSVSPAGLVGGGCNPHAGEVSFAHKGVLFMDEFTEYKKSTIELLRTPLEKKYIEHTRNNITVKFPCDFTLVAAMNPCPCGYYPDKTKCHCSEEYISRYLSRISYPIIDRIDIVTQVQAVKPDSLMKKKSFSDDSYVMRKKVEDIVKIQKERFEGSGISRNSEMNPVLIEKYCQIDEEGRMFLKKAFDKLALSARGYHKILKVARTIADSENEKQIQIKHLEEAVMYRSTDRLLCDWED